MSYMTTNEMRIHISSLRIYQINENYMPYLKSKILIEIFRALVICFGYQNNSNLSLFLSQCLFLKPTHILAMAMLQAAGFGIGVFRIT